jgi:alkaline phosphatase
MSLKGNDMIMKKLSSIFLIFALSSCTHVPKAAAPKLSVADTPKNVIFMIVDGMGFEYVKAARIYNGMKPLAFEEFACQSRVTTCSVAGADATGACINGTDDVTDSAAAATAIATGVKVKNGVISEDLPHNSEAIATILEISKAQGKSTGVVATKLFSDATPAAFASHAKDRNDTKDILSSMFNGVTPNVVFGADNEQHRLAATKASVPYHLASNASELKSLTAQLVATNGCAYGACPYVYGGFGEHELIPEVFPVVVGLPLQIAEDKMQQKNLPRLHEMAQSALDLLSQNDQGFFLMVESSHPDTIGHHNRHIDQTPNAPSAINVLIKEMQEVEKTAQVLENFVRNHPGTLLILTADHETGGLKIDMDQTACLGKTGCVPQVRWTSALYEDSPASIARHTNVDVPLYAIGSGAQKYCQERLNNTDLMTLALGK